MERGDRSVEMSALMAKATDLFHLFALHDPDSERTDLIEALEDFT